MLFVSFTKNISRSLVSDTKSLGTKEMFVELHNIVAVLF